MAVNHRISIVIVSLNGERRISWCLKSVLESDWSDLELIVVDNGSTDRTTEAIKSAAPGAKLIRAEKNLGFAGGNNLGIAEATGNIIVLLNDDCEPRHDWLKAWAAAGETLPDWGVMGCKLLYPGSDVIQHAGGLLEPNALTKHIGYMEHDRGQYGEVRRCDYVTGAAFAIRREALERVGTLDPEYFPIYFEECDFCFRVARAGYGVYYVPAAVVVHHESMTTKRMSYGFLCKYQRNRLRFIIKNFDGPRLRRAIRREIGWLVRDRPWDCLLPLARAYIYALLHASALSRARRENQRSQSPQFRL